jgi:hypothetical protein
MSPNPTCSPVWGFHGGGYEEYYLLGYNAIQTVENQETGIIPQKTVLFSNIATKKWYFFLLKSWVTQNFITIKTSWNTND